MGVFYVKICVKHARDAKTPHFCFSCKSEIAEFMEFSCGTFFEIQEPWEILMGFLFRQAV